MRVAGVEPVLRFQIDDQPNQAVLAGSTGIKPDIVPDAAFCQGGVLGVQSVDDLAAAVGFIGGRHPPGRSGVRLQCTAPQFPG